MESKYPITTIGEVCLVGDGAHSKVKRQPLGIPYLTSKNIGSGYLKLEKVDFIDKKDFEKLFSKNSRAIRRPLPGDVLIGIIGTFGNAYRYKETDYFGISSSIAILRPDPSLLDADYLYYVVTSDSFKQQHSSYKSGSVQGYTNIPTIKCLSIPIPPLPEQKAIARILSSLDDKIELNQQMNRTLEAQARAIFKSWFVDFDPVRAKMDGRQPIGMDAATAELFPDAFEESELGMIPKGWKVETFDRIVDILNGGTPKTSVPEYWNGNIPWFSVKDTPDTSDLFVLDTERKITKLGVEKSSTQILPVGTTIITARGTVGKVALVSTEMAMNQSCFGIKGVNGYSDLFIYYQLRTLISDLQQNTHGSVFDTINRDTFKSVKAAVFTPLVAQKFDKTIESLVLKIKHNLIKNTTLSTLRDTLLPKLMSGQIRVKDAEKMVVEAT
jgi:type I restriction enzyme S subunit